MSNSTQLQTEIANLLGFCQQFLAILQEEYTALAERQSANTLEEILVRKKSIFMTLNDAEQRLASALGVPLGIPTFNEILNEAVQEHPASAVTWQQIRDLLIQCRNQNRLNGLVVNTNLQRTRDLLAFLLPRQDNLHAGTYNARGSIE